MRRSLRDNNNGSMAAISLTLVLVGRVVTATLTLSSETELMALSLLLGVALYRLQRLLVAKRRCTGHWLVQYAAMAAYYLPAPLAFYAANAVCSTSSKGDESTPWLIFGVGCMFQLSVPVRMGVPVVANMRAYSLRDRPRDRYHFLLWLLFLGCLDWEWAQISSSNWLGRLALAGHVAIYFGMLIMILFDADNTSESTLDCQTKAVADYMKQQKSSISSSTSSSPFFDDDDANRNSNSSLLMLDCCRYPFVQGKDGEWVTVKDLFHQCGGDLPARDKDICLSYSLCRLLARRYYGFHCAEEGDDMVRRFALADLGRTREDGYKRAFKIVEDVFDGVYWRNKIGQYSILQDIDRRRSPKKALVAWFQGIMLSQPSYEFVKNHPVEEEELDMKKLDSMRELVADTLLSIDGPPTNGTRSPKINMDNTLYDWSWTCKQETHTDTILIWHIATCYCDITPISDDPLVKRQHGAARALSRYCAYLVAFLPEFLPEHSLTTKQVFQRVLQEAQGALGKTPMEEKEKYTKMQELPLSHQREQQTTFQKGVELGRQLDKLNDTHLRWKVMAEFWAETILYVAPSENAEAHIEQLAKGGEFITHLWAMLSNAGITKQATEEWHPPHASTIKREPPKKIEITKKARTQECPF